MFGTARIPAALVLSCALHLWPVFAYEHVPTQDGPSHAYNAHVLLHLDAPQYARRYVSDWSLTPNLAGNAVLVSLGAVVGVFWAERVLIVGAVFLFALGLWRLTRSEDGEASPLVFLAPLIVAGHPLWMGFYSFTLGLALVPWAWNCGLRNRPGWILGLSLLAALSHPVAGAAAVVGAFVLGARDRATAARLAAAGTPVGLGLLAWAAGRSGGGVSLDASTLVEALATWRAAAPVEGPAEWAAMAAAGLVAVGWARGGFERRASLLAAGFGTAHFVLPNGGDGHWFLSDRLALLVWLSLLVGAARWRAPLVMWGIVPVVAGMVAIGAAGGLQARAAAVAQVTAHSGAIEAEQTIVLLDFAPTSPPRAVLHAAGRIAVARDAVDAGTYEPHTDHFQTRFRDGIVMVDPNVLVGSPHSLDLARFASRLDVIFVVDLAAAPEAFRARLLERYRPEQTHGRVTRCVRR